MLRFIGFDDDGTRNRPRRSLGTGRRDADRSRRRTAARGAVAAISRKRSSSAPDKSMSRRSIWTPTTESSKTPHGPTLRVATPILTPTASRSALSSSMSTCGRRSTASGHRCGPARRSMSSTSRGDYLVHPDRSREFGSQLGKPTDWQSRLPVSGASLAGTTQAIARHRPGSSRPAGRGSASRPPSGRQRMGRRHRSQSLTPSSWRRRRASGTPPFWSELIAVLCAAVLALSDREVADPADRPADRGRRRARPKRQRSPFPSTPAARPACWRAHLRRRWRK